ncbi:RidA family protein [Pseudomonas putida]|uniref:RidA family protein n=1 Tax=Pseudomonas putida TaxID=303 RepID=UPI002363D4D6|nr:RidA family protein [Pseudomonas putida]MDD2055517.1 RidA family protein [Pseudomonas putida]
MHKTALNPPTVFNTLQYGFSQAMEVRGGRRLLLSGQVGVDANERTVGPGLLEQSRAALANIATLLAEVGGGLEHVVMLRIYIAESAREEQDALVSVLRECFPVDPPPSSWIIVSGLSLPQWLIEIEAEAALP